MTHQVLKVWMDKVPGCPQLAMTVFLFENLSIGAPFGAPFVPYKQDFLEHLKPNANGCIAL